MSVLVLEDVTKDYPTGSRTYRALESVNLTLADNEVVAVMGPSGAGKTTMLTISGALQRATAGEVRIDGRSLTGLTEAQLAAVRREKVGFVFQSFNLLQSLTAVENVQYVLELGGFRGKHARNRALDLLSMLGMDNRANEMPRSLSGGEQQRVAIARAFANNGVFVLADEPTANLDHERALRVMEIMKALSRDMGRPVLMVTHDLRTHHFADRLFWLEGGKLEPVSHEELAIKGVGPEHGATVTAAH
jgi:putative ABC transport system ATP-binding protein